MKNDAIYWAAVEAACKAVWESEHSDLGPWPDACPDAERWRNEESDALEPALKVLEEAGVLRWH